MEPLVSVIVPIYNVEKYLKKCVDSIINQTLNDIEIILVNDGSTDNCGKIIDEYAKVDNRVIAIHKANGGQSSARNRGLDIAKGKYIGFIDSDDSIDSEMYELLYNAIEESKSDICACGRQVHSEDGELINKLEIQDELIDLDNYPVEDYIVDKLFYKHTVVVWNKIYKKEIIDKYNIRFENVDYVGSEDALFNYAILCHVKNIKSINKICYNQLCRCESTANTYKYGYMNRTANMIKCMENYANKTNTKKLFDKISPIFLLFYYQWNMSNIKSVANRNINKLIINEIKDASSNNEFMKCVRNLAFNMNLNKYMSRMGFRLNGILMIKSIMCLYYFKLYKLATKIITLK